MADKLVTKLTEEQTEQIEIYRKKWNDNFFKAEFDEKKAREFVHWLYSLIGKTCREIIVLDSPHAVQVEINRRNPQQNGKMKYYNFDYWGDTSWFGYLCLYDYINHVIFPEVKNEIFEKYLEFSKSKINFLITFENIAFISKPPVRINFNPNNLFHNICEKAVEYADGWGLYALNGVFFEKELFKKIVSKQIHAKDILKIGNVEQRSQVLLIYGNERLMKDLNAKLVDTGKPRKFRNSSKTWCPELFELEGLPEKMVRYSDPSTERVYLSFVPREIKTAAEGLGWKFEAKEYEYEIMEIDT